MSKFGDAMNSIFGRGPIQGQPPINPAIQSQPLAPPQSNDPAKMVQDPSTQTQQTQQTAPNGVVPVASPTDKYADLWKTPAADPNAPQGPEPVSAQKIMEAAGTVDFSRVITPEQLQAISKGGDEAVQAFSQALNKTAQTVYGQSAFAATKIVEQAVSQAESRFAEKLPGLINSQASKNSLMSEKAFKDPAVAPMVEMIHAQFATKFPNATDQELIQMSREYMAAAANAFNPEAARKAQEAKTPKVLPSEDFSDL